MFQQTVNRQYTTGFPGEIVRDGPTRAKLARIISATLDTDPGASTNRIARAFGYTSDIPAQGNTSIAGRSTYAVMEQNVSVGGPVFFGLLGNPKRYALQGTAAGGSLAPTLDLPQGIEGEFFDMATGFVAELFNDTTGAKSVQFGASLAYVPNNISGANNPLALPFGAIVAVNPGDSVPTGFVAIPNSRVINPISLGASALGALVAGYTPVQLTQ